MVGLASVSAADAAVTGIGSDFSTPPRPLLGVEDSVGASTVPKTYIYTLILDTVSSLCEGLSKFVMPLSVMRHRIDVQADSADEDADETGPREVLRMRTKQRNVSSHKYQRLANPLKMHHLSQLSQVQMCAEIIDEAWPAILASSFYFSQRRARFALLPYAHQIYAEVGTSVGAHWN